MTNPHQNPWDPHTEADMHAAWEAQQAHHIPWNRPTNGRGWLAIVRTDKTETPPAGPADPFDVARGGTSGGVGYAQAALDAECERVMSAPTGQRNHTLNRAAFSLGQLVAGGELDEHVVVRELTAAARLVGLTETEIVATMHSGLTSGSQSPRSVPPRLTSAGTGWEQVGTGREQAAESTPRHAAADPEEPGPSVEDWVREHLPRLDWEALWADESTEDWIVEPILPARRLVALYSPPKVGKSLLMLEMAVGIAKGDLVLGVIPDRPRRVLYIDFENDPKGDIRERLTAMGYKPIDLDNLVYLSFPVLGALDSAAGAGQLMAAVRTYECEVVVIDTVSRAVNGEENENDTWLAFYRHTGKQLKAAGIAMIRLDHTGKDETRGQRGGSAKSGDVDAVWRMSRVTEDTFRLDCEANRMPVLEKTLLLHRETSPHLRHRVDAAGRSAVYRVQEEAVTAALDDAGLPRDAGREKAREILRAAGIKIRDTALSDVLRRRKESMGVDFGPVPEVGNRRTDVRLFPRSGNRWEQDPSDDP